MNQTAGKKDENPNKSHYYGLVAEWYDKILESESNDIEYYKKIVLKREGKCLELACGTGRLLLPILKAGIDVEGVDISSEMLAICRKKLQKNNLSAILYEHDIENFNTGKQYGTIFISGGSFQLIYDIEKVQKCLRIIYSHLETGGLFILDIYNPRSEIKSNRDGVWTLGRTAVNDKNEKFCCFGCATYDLHEQVKRGTYKYELYRNNQLYKTVLDKINLRWYCKHEFKLMLEKAGFTKIRMDRENIMSTHGDTIVYRAYKGKR